MATDETRFEHKRVKSSYFSVVMSMALVLFMVGVLGFLLLRAEEISDYVKERFTFSVYVKEKAKDLEISALQKEISLSGYAKSVRFVSKAEAARSFQRELGTDFMDFLGYNPLLNSIDIRVKADYVDPAKMKRIADKLGANPIVESVVYEQSLLNKVSENVEKISIGLLILAAAFLIIAIALINSSIRLAIYARRFLIKTMQLVGATKGFIRKPFISKGVELSLVAALLALLLLTGLLFYLERELGAYIQILDYKSLAVVYVGVTGTGVCIAWLSTYRAASKFLNLKSDDLYG